MVESFDYLIAVHPAAFLTLEGRCCGRKPLEYKRPPHLFCTRCNRNYDPKSGLQQPSFGWVAQDGGFRLSDTAIRAAVATHVWQVLTDPSAIIARQTAESFVQDAYADGRLR